MTIEADYLSGIGIKKLSRKYGIGWRSIIKHLSNRNISIRESQEKQFDTNEVINLYQNGSTIPELARRYGVSDSAIWLRLKNANIECRDYKYYQKYDYDLSQLKNLTSEIGSYWFGFLLADGHISTVAHHGGTQHSLICKLSSRDYGHLVKLSEAIRVDKLPIIVDRYNRWRDKTYQSAILSINSKELCDFYIDNGWNDFKNGSFIAPKWLNMRHFLRGLWDGDGTVSYNSHKNKKYLSMAYNDMSDKILRFIQLSIINLIYKQTSIKIRQNKINPYKTKHNTQMYRMSWTGRQAIEIARVLYSNCEVVLDRKQLKVNEYISD